MRFSYKCLELRGRKRSSSFSFKINAFFKKIFFLFMITRKNIYNIIAYQGFSFLSQQLRNGFWLVFVVNSTTDILKGRNEVLAVFKNGSLGVEVGVLPWERWLEVGVEHGFSFFFSQIFLKRKCFEKNWMGPHVRTHKDMRKWADTKHSMSL